MSLIDITKCIICNNYATKNIFNENIYYFCHCTMQNNRNNYFYEIRFIYNKINNFYLPLKKLPNLAIYFYDKVLSFHIYNNKYIKIYDNFSINLDMLTTEFIESMTKKFLLLKILD